MIDFPELAEARRPGIDKLCQRISAEHPSWRREQCVAEAKSRYHSRTILHDGVEVPNPDYLAGRDR